MKKGFNLSKIMSKAWALAREGAKRFGGNARLYFSSALSISWKEEKALAIMRETKAAMVYHKGLGNRFLLPGIKPHACWGQNGQAMLPGISE